MESLVKARELACNHRHVRDQPVSIWHFAVGNVVCPKQREVRLGHFADCGQIEPNLKQLQRVGGVKVEQWKHFGVHDTFACS